MTYGNFEQGKITSNDREIDRTKAKLLVRSKIEISITYPANIDSIPDRSRIDPTTGRTQAEHRPNTGRTRSRIDPETANSGRVRPVEGSIPDRSDHRPGSGRSQAGLRPVSGRLRPVSGRLRPVSGRSQAGSGTTGALPTLASGANRTLIHSLTHSLTQTQSLAV